MTVSRPLALALFYVAKQRCFQGKPGDRRPD
jgi:hypothetical protein